MKKKDLVVECHFKEDGLTIDRIIADTFFLYFRDELVKKRESYE